VGVTQPNQVSYELRLKFGKQAYCVIELHLGEDAFDVANKLRELAAQVAASLRATYQRGELVESENDYNPILGVVR
jgi:hypothetical protein